MELSWNQKGEHKIKILLNPFCFHVKNHAYK